MNTIDKWMNALDGTIKPTIDYALKELEQYPENIPWANKYRSVRIIELSKSRHRIIRLTNKQTNKQKTGNV